ncbi:MULTISPECIES: FAD-binding protein [unclassified Arthrobacter]|uniref:FAD-binding protein n=1 Tax=unclassified Arthrobacter TaxID=235627 RepID=UPI001D133D3A|nr:MULTISPECIES: FAD-binding protein [unclassified Arthrobacter]MCC3275543.1 FAD-binding protein [Arthrobacter sp. zg-Y20]MCC9176984.1 FAD-binding protein [Arthrobacter sp. zg-Y750]MDK1315700.1 FAD-binding protein [Arthrobacter sp. zg.Y20]WIB06109.1 FAD-binding protein [Arthrobacter sp. zg-Y20]
MPEGEQFDVIVVGYGDAGAAAAIEAADNGARVLVLDRSYGGGASALSGGVVYAGGGTRQQREAGYDDTVENLYNYLRQESGDSVDDETLRRFCAESPGTITWLEQQGAVFGSSVPDYKTSYPTDRHYLYFSGNEKAHPYKLHAEPAPRGHRAVAKGLASGKVLWTALASSARRKGVTFVPLAQVHDLIIEDGAVVGVKYRVLDRNHANAAEHARLTRLTGKIGNWAPGLVKGPVAKIKRLWEEGAVDREARASAVVLAAGGFIYNEEWLQRHAPEFTGISPLGTPADDGTGIRLGMDAGGTTAKMGNVTAWRFLSPPSAFIEGVTVGLNGRRIKNEDLYGATHGNTLMREFGGKGWAVYDSVTWKKAQGQVRSQTQIFQRLQVAFLLTVGHKKAGTLAELAMKIGVDAAGLQRTVEAYNHGIADGTGDPAHKDPALSVPLLKAPFYAYNISVDASPFYPIPGLTLGGLVVDGESGLVQRQDGTLIPGLYAAGRNAVGVCSESYVSGLSLADCIFSGRRAGRHAVSAREAKELDADMA